MAERELNVGFRFADARKLPVSFRPREAIQTRPTYSEDENYQISPGGTLTLMTSDRRYGLTNCRIYAVETL